MQRVLLFVVIFGALLHAKLSVIATIVPQMSFIKAIGGDKVEVTVMVPPGAEPHTYEPKPAQMIALSKANIYFSLNLPFEKAWLPKLRAQNSKMEVVNAAKRVEKIVMSSNIHEQNSSLDPHIWTSIANVKIIAKNIYQALIKYDSANTSYYKSNYERFIEKLSVADSKIKKLLSSTPKGAKFMVFHPAWGYFAKEYGLKQIAIEQEGKNPTPKSLIHLVKLAKENRVQAIFTEPEFNQKAAKVLASEIGIPVVAISPLDANFPQNIINLARAIAHSK